VGGCADRPHAGERSFAHDLTRSPPGAWWRSC
jgi:hypothetical protein